MSNPRPSIAVLLLAGLVLAGCATPENDTPANDGLESTPGGDDGDEQPDLQVDDTELDGTDDDGQRGQDFQGDQLTEADVTSRMSPLGEHLVDGQGRTLYMFTADAEGTRTCTGDCLQTWPVFSTGDEVPTVDGQAREELVGTIAGDGAGQQVTYNDQPLYYYVGDDQVGDINGQGIGGQWFAVASEGVPIEEESY